MRVGLVWKDDFPWDPRVDKIARTLMRVGHTVHVLARNSRAAVPYEEIDGLPVHRLPALANGRLNGISGTPVFFNPRWIAAIDRLCREQRLDVLIARDMPLVLSCARVARRHGVRLVFDMAENYPAMWRGVNAAGRRTVGSMILKNPAVADWLERCSLEASDLVLVVVEESRERLLELGVPDAKIELVSNTPDIVALAAMAAAAPGTTAEATSGSERARAAVGATLLYQGFVNRPRGLQTVIEGLPMLLERHPATQIVIAGAGDYLQPLRELAARMGVAGHVSLVGWVDHRRIPAMIRAADVGLVPHLYSDHTNTTVPNKIFDYMAESRPVLVSHARPLARIARAERCGLVFESGDPHSFAATATALLDDPREAVEMGRRGLDAVRREYNWERDAARLSAAFATLAR